MRVWALLVVVALIGFGAVAAGCGDDGEDPLTLEQYFERVGELDDEQSSRSDALEQGMENLGLDASPDEVADSFDEQVDVLQDFADDLDDIEPPQEVEDTHNRVITSLRAARDQFDAVIDDFRDADSVDEAFASLDDADFAALDDATEACRELEQIAADNDIEADFDCDDSN